VVQTIKKRLKVRYIGERLTDDTGKYPSKTNCIKKDSVMKAESEQNELFFGVYLTGSSSVYRQSEPDPFYGSGFVHPAIRLLRRRPVEYGLASHQKHRHKPAAVTPARPDVQHTFRSVP